MNRRLPHTKAAPSFTGGEDRPQPACANQSRAYDLLHDYQSGPIYNAAVNEARQICGTCPLQASCLAENRTTPWVQALIRGPVRTRGGEPVRQIEASCGTDGGYYRHLRGTKTRPKSEPCDSCRAAHADAAAGRKPKKRATCDGCGCLLLAGEACPKCQLDAQGSEVAA